MMKDSHDSRPVLGREDVWKGKIFSVVREEVDLGESSPAIRDYLDHSGSVAILALDDQERVAMIRQYRHPVRATLWEIPAGLLDAPGENPLDAAKRELAEEAELAADTWHVLTDLYLTPGASNEALRVFLARDLREVTIDYVRTEEEADLEFAWVPLDDAMRGVREGRIHSPSAVVGILAAVATRGEWDNLRTPDSTFFPTSE